MLCRTSVVATLAALLAVAAAACGGGTTASGETTVGAAGHQATVSAEAFRQAVRDTRDAVQNAIDDVRQSHSKQDVANALQQGSDNVARAADRLQQTQAPDNLQSAKSALAQAAHDLAGQMSQAASGVDSGNFMQALSSLEGLNALAQVKQAIADLRAQGVDVQSLQTG
jgi:biotin operon repressor